MTELTLLIRSQFSLWLNCYEMLSCYYVVVYIYRQKLITRHSTELYCNYTNNYLSWNSVYPYSRMVIYHLLLFMLKIEISTRGTNSMPFLVFRRDHFRSTSGIIFGPGSFAIQLGHHFRPGDHLRSGIICGAVQY